MGIRVVLFGFVGLDCIHKGCSVLNKIYDLFFIDKMYRIQFGVRLAIYRKLGIVTHQR